MQQVFSQGQAIAQFPVEGGANSVVVEPGDPVNTVLPILLEKEKLTWTYADRTGALTAPLEKGQKVSEVQVWYGSTCVAVTDLVAMHDVSSQMAPVDASRPTHQNYEGSWSLMMIVFAVLAAVAVIGVGVYMIPGFVRKIRLQARRRRRRSERRRNR